MKIIFVIFILEGYLTWPSRRHRSHAPAQASVGMTCLLALHSNRHCGRGTPTLSSPHNQADGPKAATTGLRP